MSMSKCSQRGTKINVFSSVLAKALLRHEGNSKTVSRSPADIGTGRERKRYKVVLQFPALASLFISPCTACLPFHFCKAAYCWETDAQTEPRRSINISGSVFVLVEEIHKDIDLKKKKKAWEQTHRKRPVGLMLESSPLPLFLLTLHCGLRGTRAHEWLNYWQCATLPHHEHMFLFHLLPGKVEEMQNNVAKRLSFTPVCHLSFTAVSTDGSNTPASHLLMCTRSDNALNSLNEQAVWNGTVLLGFFARPHRLSYF